MFRKLSLTREHRAVLTLCDGISSGRRAARDKWFRKRWLDVKQKCLLHLCVSQIPNLLYPHFILPISLTWCTPSSPLDVLGEQHVESGSSAGDLVRHPNAGPVPPGVRHPRGPAERPVLPIPRWGGGGGRVWLRHGPGAVCGHRGRQPAPRAPVPLRRARRPREVAAEIFQPHLPVQQEFQWL